MGGVESEPVTPLAVTLPGRPAELHAGIIAAFALGRSTPQERHPHPSTTLLKSGLDRLALRLGDGESVYVDRTDHLIVQMATHRPLAARRRMQSLIGGLVRSPLVDEDGPTHVDVGSAWTRLSGEIFTDASRMREVSDQADQSLRNRDLVLRSGERAKARRKPAKAFIPLLTVLSIALTFALPLAIMMLAYLAGVDISGFVYLGLVAVLLLMSATQLAEGLSALRKNPLPPPSATPAPPATAIVAAYLPNEAATILETLRSVLSQKYDGGLQVILAYNSPVSLPVEDELRALAAQEPRLELLRVAYSRSKADNVNAALAIVTGEFVGIFDADHHPMVGSFERAWRWFADGADVVQGHCVVRNGDESGIARLVAVEFEQIYAVSHPGRQRLHHFGIFGGSNGYWRTQLLRETRLRSQFLTEDIDSSIRAVRMGARIVNDPGLISRELAPVNFRALEAADAVGPGMVRGEPAPRPLRHLAQRPEPAPALRPVDAAGLARTLPLDRLADVADPRVLHLARQRNRSGQCSAGVLAHDGVHADDRPDPDRLRLQARRSGDPRAHVMVVAVRLRVGDRVLRAEEHHRARGADPAHPPPGRVGRDPPRSRRSNVYPHLVGEPDQRLVALEKSRLPRRIVAREVHVAVGRETLENERREEVSRVVLVARRRRAAAEPARRDETASHGA